MSLEAHHQFIINTMMRHDDIARKLIHELEVENARLKTDAQVILKHLDEASADCARLKEEVERLKMEESKLLTLCETYEGDLERLIKAGDAMAEALNLNDDVFDNRDKREAQAAWLAAKEGKQP